MTGWQILSQVRWNLLLGFHQKAKVGLIKLSSDKELNITSDDNTVILKYNSEAVNE